MITDHISCSSSSANKTQQHISILAKNIYAFSASSDEYVHEHFCDNDVSVLC